jgi:hypothetical protein
MAVSYRQLVGSNRLSAESAKASVSIITTYIYARKEVDL